MDVIYLDSLFGLNLLIDYCLVLASARVCGVVLHRWRYALAALIGALYAALMVLPGCGWLANGAMKLALGAAMALIAFGGEAHLVRCTVVFFAVSAAFGGAVYAASMLAGVSPGSGALVTVSGRVLALSFAACYAAVSLVFRRRAKAADREVRTVTVTLAGRSVTLKALRVSGNGGRARGGAAAVSSAARAAGRRSADTGGAQCAAGVHRPGRAAAVPRGGRGRRTAAGVPAGQREDRRHAGADAAGAECAGAHI